MKNLFNEMTSQNFKMFFKVLIVNVLVISFSFSTLVFAKDWNFSSLETLPIQSGGRLKPLDSLARETVLLITGKRHWINLKGQNIPAVQTLIEWMSHAEQWEDERFIWINRQQVRRQLVLDESRLYFSPRELSENPVLLQYARSGAGNLQQVVPGQVGPIVQDARADELRRVFQRLSVYRSITGGDAWTIVPANQTTMSSPHLLSLTDPLAMGDPVQQVFVKLLQTYHKGEQVEFEQASINLKDMILSRLASGDPAQQSKLEKPLKLEVFYKKSRPFLWAWIIYLLSALFGIVGIVTRGSAEDQPSTRPLWVRLAIGVGGVGFLIHAAGFGLRCYVAGRPPVTNMYESIVWVALGASAFAFGFWIRERIAKNNRMETVFLVFVISQVVAALGLMIADSAPALLDPSLQPLVPVLRSNLWLTIHVLTITLSYGAFAVALGVANVALWGVIRNGRPGRLVELNDWAYRAIQFGVVLLAAGIILGGVWADYSWGRFWGWDPKETWALIALLGYLVLLHSRYTGWIGPFGFSVATAAAFLGIVMAWYGVNFVLGAGLHSYGFSSGGSVPVAIACLLQICYLLLAAGLKRKRDSIQTPKL